MREEKNIFEMYTDEEIEIMKQELVEKHQELNTKLNMGTLTDEDREEWERVRIDLDEITKFQTMGREFFEVETRFNELSEEVNRLKENNIVDSMTVTFEERINYINRLQEIPKELDKLLESEALNNESLIATELREKIVSVRNDVLDYVKNQINKVVAAQMKKLANIESHAQRLFNELQHDFTELHDISEELNGLIDEFESFKRDLPALRELVAEVMDINPYSITETQLKSRVADLAGFLREIRRAQIVNYNNMVAILNENITSLSLEIGLPQELMDRINGLETLTNCNMPARLAYNSVGYLREMNYAKLIEMMKLANDIKKEIEKFRGNGGQGQGEGGGSGDDENPPVKPTDDTPSIEAVLEAELRTIEENVYALNDSFNAEMTDEEIANYKGSIENLEKNIADFKLKLEENKDKLSEEKYKEFYDRANAMENLLRILRERVTVKDKTTGYALFKQSVELLRNRVEYEVNHLLESRFTDNKIPQTVFEHFMNRLDGFSNEIEGLRNDAKEQFEAGRFDKTQFDNLMEMLDSIEKIVVDGKNKVESFEIMKEEGILDLLNGDLDGLEASIEKFGAHIDMLNAPIGRKNRKLLDEMYKSILNEIARIENNLNHLKEKDPDKYEEEMKRLDACKEKLEVYNKKYRSKCPFMVKTWRSAKNWCKKHPKLAMLAAGLAAVALTHMIVGPVLIPAIMHGNILIANKVAFLRPLISGVNKLLGGAINASLVNTSINGMTTNVWRLANGLMISPTVSTGSLLKGIAMVAGASAPLVAPLVVGVKKLAGKIRNKEENKEFTKEKKTEKFTEKVTGKIKDTVGKIPEKVKPKKKATLGMLREYLLLKTPEEKNEYFSKLTEEQRREIMEVYGLTQEEYNKKGVDPLEEEKVGGKGR